MFNSPDPQAHPCLASDAVVSSLPVWLLVKRPKGFPSPGQPRIVAARDDYHLGLRVAKDCVQLLLDRSIIGESLGLSCLNAPCPANQSTRSRRLFYNLRSIAEVLAIRVSLLFSVGVRCSVPTKNPGRRARRQNVKLRKSSRIPRLRECNCASARSA